MICKYIKAIAVIASCTSSLSFADDCFDDPGIEDKPAYNGSPMGNDGQKALTEQKNEENSNPAMEATMCFMQAAFQGPQGIIDGICGCKEAIEANCDFGWDDGVAFADPSDGVSYAVCATFAPVYLGVNLL